MTAPFDLAPLLAPGTPPPAIQWKGFPKYNFVGGHNDAKHVPVQALIDAATNVLKREGATLAKGELLHGTSDPRFRDAWAMASATSFRPDMAKAA